MCLSPCSLWPALHISFGAHSEASAGVNVPQCHLFFISHNLPSPSSMSQTLYHLKHHFPPPAVTLFNLPSATCTMYSIIPHNLRNPSPSRKISARVAGSRRFVHRRR
ncbi:unnamed protein product, partial [Ectocarpus sp. 12 AP-2014]